LEHALRARLGSCCLPVRLLDPEIMVDGRIRVPATGLMGAERRSRPRRPAPWRARGLWLS